MTLYIRTETKYGRPLRYPACELSDVIAAWIGRKTFTERDLKYLTRIGFSVVEHPKRDTNESWMR